MIESLQNALGTFLEYIPQLIGAIVILIVGYLIARPSSPGSCRPWASTTGWREAA
jgi:hypothetical protein